MIIDLFRAMQAGEALANAKTWKQAQLWTSNLTILLGAAVSIAAAFGHPIPLTPEQITTVVSALAVLFGVFQSYVTVATTEKLGVRPAAEPYDPGIPDTSRRATVPGAWLRKQISTVVSALAVLVGMFQSYVTVSTTEKLGVRPDAEPDDAGIPDTSRRATVPGAWLRELDDRYLDDVPILKDKE